ncbi:MAG: hypothetical protein V1694_08465 [Candidatus Eisenbacteria bacterium]
MKGFKKIKLRPEFLRDIRRLTKKFRTIEEDLRIFIETQLVYFHKLKLDNRGVFRIPDLEAASPPIYKAKKFACRSLRGTGSRSGIRVIYAYFEVADRIELIEIYYKDDQDNADRDRISRFFQSIRDE